MRQWLSGQLGNPIKKAIPILSFPSVQLLNCTVKDLIGSSEMQADGMAKIAARTNSAASLSMMDLSVEAEAFGCEIRFFDDEVPTVVGSIIDTEQEAENLLVPAVGAGRTGRYIEAIRMAAGLITDRPVFAGVIGPFSLAGRLMDVSEALTKCITEPEMVHAAMRKTTPFLIEYIKGYRAAGAGGVVLAEPLTGILSPKLAAEFSEPYVREIAQATREDDFLVIYHNCGNNTILMIDSILATGCDAYHFGNSISMAEMLQKVPAHIPVLGNVDPASQFRNGTPQSVYAETKRIMAECCPGHPNFIISSGCDIPPMSSWDNIDAFFSAVDDYYAGS